MKANYKYCNKTRFFALTMYQKVMNSLLNFMRHIPIMEKRFAERIIYASVFQ